MSPKDSATTEDPYEFDGKLPEDCYQAWVGKNVVVKEKDTSSKYPRVVETGRSPRPRHYPSPRERGVKMGFMERMKEMASSSSPVVVKIKEKKKGARGLGVSLKQDLFDKLNCSPKMKQFLTSEFQREKNLYNYLPEEQVRHSVIHRYKTHVKNSEAKKKSMESHKKVIKNVKIGKSIVSKVELYDGEDETLKNGDETNQDDGENLSDCVIEEFDESSLVPPPGGSFSLQPPPSLLRSPCVLLKFCQDSSSPFISESPKKALTISPPAAIKAVNSPLGKVKLSSSLLPNLLSSSPVTEDTDSCWAQGRGLACAWCLQPGRLQLCSQCQTSGYCSQACQRSSWPSHKKVCKRLRSATATLRQELLSSMKTLKTVGVRKVQFNSQPDFELGPGESKVNKRSEVVVGPSTPRPILKKVVVQQVPFSPPVLSLKDHLVLASQGDQEHRFDELKEGKRNTSLGRPGEERKVKKNLGNIFKEDTVDDTDETTPPNNSSVVAVVRRESEQRSHSRGRVRARRPDTPYTGGEEARQPQGLDQEGELGGGLMPQTLSFDVLEENTGEIDEAFPSPDMFGSQSEAIPVNINDGDQNVPEVDSEEVKKNIPVESEVYVEMNEQEGDEEIQRDIEDMDQDVSECSGSSLGVFSPIALEEPDFQENVPLLGVSGGRMYNPWSVVRRGTSRARLEQDEQMEIENEVRSGEQLVSENVSGELFEEEESNRDGEEEVVLGMAVGHNSEEEDQLADLFSTPEGEAEEDEEDILSNIM